MRVLGIVLVSFSLWTLWFIYGEYSRNSELWEIHRVFIYTSGLIAGGCVGTFIWGCVLLIKGNA